MGITICWTWNQKFTNLGKAWKKTGFLQPINRMHYDIFNGKSLFKNEKTTWTIYLHASWRFATHSPIESFPQVLQNKRCFKPPTQWNGLIPSLKWIMFIIPLTLFASSLMKEIIARSEVNTWSVLLASKPSDSRLPPGTRRRWSGLVFGLGTRLPKTKPPKKNSSTGSHKTKLDKVRMTFCFWVFSNAKSRTSPKTTRAIFS